DRQVAQMTRLIDDLLDVSRITRGKIALRPQRTDLKTVLDAAVEGARPLLDARRHALHVAVPDPPPPLHGDVARLVQVFTNLLHNAGKYTDEGGRIEVAARVEPGDEASGDPGRVVVCVADNGAGIPRPMLSGIFDMFAQVDQTLDRSHGGLGIGLTLVKTLVELHGGSVSAESDGPGRGSTFRVTLPLAEKGTEPAPRPAAAPPASGRLPSRRMLVVDDMRPSARTLAMMLKGIGQETQVAHDGASALAAVEEFRPDVVLLDIAMPGMDGYEVCRRIRERPGPCPLLVALTGYGQEEDRRRAFEAGFDRHLVKPTSLDALRALLVEAGPVGGRRAAV
ncbi:MAG TPA: ATP-binding protein, partial [Planctomycetaceae bacterium]